MRVRHRDFSKGLWVSSSRDGQPAGTLRRAKGVRPLLQPSLRSRWGSSALGAALTSQVYQIVTFNGTRYVVSGAALRKIDNSLVTGLTLDTFHPVFVAGIPTIDTDAEAFTGGPAHLICAGARRSNVPFKMDTGSNATQLGFSPPGDQTGYAAVQAGIGTQRIKVIDGFNSEPPSAGGWVAGGNGNIQAVTQPRRSGVRAMQIQVSAANTTVTVGCVKDFGNLDTVGGIPSSAQDWITLWLDVDNIENLDSINLKFGVAYPNPIVASNPFFQNFSFQILVDNTLEPITVKGAADFAEFTNENFTLEKFVLPASQSTAANPTLAEAVGATETSGVAAKITNALAVTKLPPISNVWIQLKIPKAQFIPSDASLNTPAGASGWFSVKGVKIDVRSNSNGPVNVYIDDLALYGGSGLIGDYKYLFTFKNSKTGTRSNPNVNPIIVKNVQRNEVALTSLPFSINNGADLLEIWRTVGSGSVYFYADAVPNTGTPALYTDRVADFIGLNDFPTIANPGTAYVKTLQAIILPTDNTRVPITCQDVCGPHFGRLFWTRDTEKGSRNRMYFSPPGRLEVVEGFVLVSADDDPMQKGVIWNGAAYGLSSAHFFAIEGSGPFISTEIFGVPGTNQPASVVPSPYGIIYWAADGPRVFNGTSAELLAPEGLLALFRGEGLNDLSTFVGELAVYHNDEYIVTDETETMTLACNLRTGVWRNVGVPLTAMYHEPTTGSLLVGASGGSRVLQWEVPNVTTDNGSSIPFDVELPGTLVENQSGITKLVQRLYVDADTTNQALAMEFRRLDSAQYYALPNLQTNGRGLVEVSLGVACDIVSVRISGSLVTAVEIFGVEYDVHVPEEAIP